MNHYKTCTAKSYCFLVTDPTVASDNPLRFINNILERILKLIMIIDDNIRNEKLQYDIDREAVKKSTLLSGKIYKVKYLTGEEILRSNRSQIKELPCRQILFPRTSQERPPPTPPGRPLKIPFDHPGTSRTEVPGTS